MNKYFLTLIIITSQVGFASTDQLCSDIGGKAKNDESVIRLCAEKTAEVFASTKTTIDKSLKAMLDKYEECMANKGDCVHYQMKVIIEHPDKTTEEKWIEVDLTVYPELKKLSEAHFNELLKGYSESCSNSVETETIDACKTKFQNPQRELDMLVNVESFFTADLFPNQMVRVDVADLLAGKPLGGAGSVIISFREGLIGANDGDIANLIRDPMHVPANLILDVTKQAASILNNICGDICRGIHVKF
jgi:hypothetical protein